MGQSSPVSCSSKVPLSSASAACSQGRHTRVTGCQPWRVCRLVPRNTDKPGTQPSPFPFRRLLAVEGGEASPSFPPPRVLVWRLLLTFCSSVKSPHVRSRRARVVSPLVAPRRVASRVARRGRIEPPTPHRGRVGRVTYLAHEIGGKNGGGKVKSVGVRQIDVPSRAVVLLGLLCCPALWSLEPHPPGGRVGLLGCLSPVR